MKAMGTQIIGRFRSSDGLRVRGRADPRLASLKRGVIDPLVAVAEPPSPRSHLDSRRLQQHVHQRLAVIPARFRHFARLLRGAEALRGFAIEALHNGAATARVWSVAIEVL